MKRNTIRMISTAVCAMLGLSSSGAVIYNQPHDSSGTIRQSSKMYPDGSDYDWFIWDSFVIPSTQQISEIRWRGGYLYNGMFSSSVPNFTIAIYPTSIAGEPDVIHPPLVEYTTGNDANETVAGTFGGKVLYDYSFILPQAFHAEAGVKYWLHIWADQQSVPEWGFAAGLNGNNSHFRRHSEYQFQFAPGDCAFSLLSTVPLCPADIDQNGTVNVSDLLTVINTWGSSGAGDVTGNGFVNVEDLLAVINAWGPCN